MRAGRLDRRVQLQHRSLSRDAQGQEVETFTTYATVWARKLDTRARETIASQQPFAENTAAFSIRYRSDVVYTDRILYGTERYNIRSVAEIGRRVSLELLATAVVS